MSEIILSFSGTNGQIEMYSDRVIIKRTGFISKMDALTKGISSSDKTIMFDKITDIEIDKKLLFFGMLHRGIVFKTNDPVNPDKDIQELKKRERTVQFERVKTEEAQEFIDAVKAAIASSKKTPTKETVKKTKQKAVAKSASKTNKTTKKAPVKKTEKSQKDKKKAKK